MPVTIIFSEPEIIINGVMLTSDQARTVRTAIANFQFELVDDKFKRALGDIAPMYQLRLNEITELMLKEKENGEPE